MGSVLRQRHAILAGLVVAGFLLVGGKLALQSALADAPDGEHRRLAPAGLTLWTGEMRDGEVRLAPGPFIPLALLLPVVFAGLAAVREARTGAGRPAGPAARTSSSDGTTPPALRPPEPTSPVRVRAAGSAGPRPIPARFASERPVLRPPPAWARRGDDPA